MPNNDDVRNGTGSGLEDRLAAIEAKRTSKITPGQAQELGEGYRFLASMFGGVLGGIGFGWVFDHFAGTEPWGLVGGLLIGSTASIVTIVRKAGRMSDKAAKTAPPPAPDLDDEDED